MSTSFVGLRKGELSGNEETKPHREKGKHMETSLGMWKEAAHLAKNQARTRSNQESADFGRGLWDDGNRSGKGDRKAKG